MNTNYFCDIIRVKVLKDNVETLYEDIVEDAPEDIKLLKCSKIPTADRVNFYVYSDLNKKKEENNESFS